MSRYQPTGRNQPPRRAAPRPAPRGSRSWLSTGTHKACSRVPYKPVVGAQSLAVSSFTRVMPGMFGALPVPKRPTQLTLIR
jgi:hypothetical protein